MSNVLNLGDVVLPGSGYPNIFEHTFPVSGGLEGLFMFSHGRTPQKNYATGKPDAAPVGSPVVGSNYTRFNGSDYLTTQINETSAMSIVFVARAVSPATTIGICGTFNGAPATGVGVYSMGGSGSITAVADRAGVASPASVAANTAAFNMVAVLINPTGQTRAFNLSSGQQGASASGARSLTGVNPLLVGRMRTSPYVGNNDMGFCAVLSREITEPDLSAIASWGRRYMSANGVIV